MRSGTETQNSQLLSKKRLQLEDNRNNTATVTATFESNHRWKVGRQPLFSCVLSLHKSFSINLNIKSLQKHRISFCMIRFFMSLLSSLLHYCQSVSPTVVNFKSMAAMTALRHLQHAQDLSTPKDEHEASLALFFYFVFYVVTATSAASIFSLLPPASLVSSFLILFHFCLFYFYVPINSPTTSS